MRREEFIKTCGLLCLGGTALTTLLEGCASANYYALAHIEKEKIVLKKSEFIGTKKDKSFERKYVLLKTIQFNFPICVFQLEKEKYSAVLMECTHKSCELQTNGNYLICPCHGSEFSNKGKVQNPPAESDLKSFAITFDHENIYIHL